jgi:hypothetical protein
MLLVLPGKRKDTGALQKPCAREQSWPAQPQSHWHVAFATGVVVFPTSVVVFPASVVPLEAVQDPRYPQNLPQPSTASATIDPFMTTLAVTPLSTAASCA